MTYEQLQMRGLNNSGSERRRSSPQGFRVSRTLLREKVSAIVTSVTCGEKWQEFWEKSDRNGSSVKIRPVYSQGTISGISEESSMTLPRWGIRSGGAYGELAMSEPRTEETECSLWLGTPNPAEFIEKFPTPLSSDAIRMRYSEESLKKVGMRRTHGEYKLAGCNLSEYVAVFPGKDGVFDGCGLTRPPQSWCYVEREE